MRISDWSSDVCSSDLCGAVEPRHHVTVKSQLRALIAQGIDALRAAGTLPADLATPDFVVERPKDRGHGDFSTNAAMLLARPAKSNPRALAQALVDALPPNDDIAAVEIVGHGFLNFRLDPGAWQRPLRDVDADGPATVRKGHSLK